MNSVLLRFIILIYKITSPIFAPFGNLKESKFRDYATEAFIILNLVLQILALYYFSKGSWVAITIATYGLASLFFALVRDAIMSPIDHRDCEGGFISIGNRPRWVILSVINLVQVPLCFATIIFMYGDEFSEIISSSTTALYYSLVTFTTLGYGDIRPTSDTGRMLIIFELLFFLLFIGIRLPIAVSVLRVRERV